MPLPGLLVPSVGVPGTASHLQAWQQQPHRRFRLFRSPAFYPAYPAYLAYPAYPAFKPDHWQVRGIKTRCLRSPDAKAPLPRSNGQKCEEESASGRRLPEGRNFQVGPRGEPAKEGYEDEGPSEEASTASVSGGSASGGTARGGSASGETASGGSGSGGTARGGSASGGTGVTASGGSASGGTAKELLLLAALTAWSMGSPQQALAYGHRRHHRRRDEDVQLAPPKQKGQPEQTKIIDFRKDASNRWQLTVDPDELKRRWASSTEAVGSGVSRAFGGVRSEAVAVGGALRSLQTSVAAPSVPGRPRTAVSGTQLGILGRAVLVLVLGVVGLLQLWRWVGSARRGGGRGVVVRDRSLGGREVFIARTPLSTDPLSVPKKPARDKSSSRARNKIEREVEMPSWWPRPQPLPPVTPGSPQELHAQAVLNGMLSRRLVGRDFSHDDILELRRACRGRAVRLAVQTGSTRDSLYRAAVEHALAAVGRGGTEIGLESPASFVAGFAENVALEPGRAAAMVKGAVAARTRATLLQAVALLRQQREDEAQGEMRALACIHNMFPSPDDSAEMDMVSHSLGSKLLMEERQSLLHLYDSSGGLATRSIVKQALGFER